MARLLEQLIAHFEVSSLQRQTEGAQGPSAAAFAEAVAARTSDVVDLDGLRLAFDCLTGQGEAIRQLTEWVHLATLRLGGRTVGDPDDRADLGQATLVLLLYGGARLRRGYLYTYAGRAPLRSWIQKAVSRGGWAKKQSEVRWRPFEAEMDRIAVSDSDPEGELVKRTYADRFARALNEGVATLSSRDREVLNKHLYEEATAAEIGSHYGVHRVTVARWLQSIRKHLFQSTAIHLEAMHRADSVCPADIFSIVEDRVSFVSEQLVA